MLQFRYVAVLILFMEIGCKPVAYFNTPNDVFNRQATIYTINGVEKKGKITITFETGHDANNFILLSNGDNKEKILVDSIKSYKVEEDYYFPKQVDLDQTGVEKFLFLRRLTKENSRIHFYELFQQKSHTSDGMDHFFYFISLPAHRRLEAWNIGSKNLVPNFDEKMSKIVADCPGLSNKIREKDKGYFLGPFTLSDTKKVEVYKRIIDEYNDCH